MHIYFLFICTIYPANKYTNLFILNAISEQQLTLYGIDELCSKDFLSAVASFGQQVLQ